MLFERLACSSLVLSVCTTACFSQAYYSGLPSRSQVNNQNGLVQRARSGDTNAEYVLGMDSEHGNGLPGGRPDLAAAISWYNMAAQRGNLRATYRIGQLLAEGKATVPSRPGSHSGPEQGRQLMQYAISHGYDPQTGQVITPEMAARLAAQQRAAQEQSQNRPASTTLTPDDAAVPLAILGGLAALLVVAAAAGSGSNTTSTSEDASSGMKFCHKYKDVWVDDQHGGGHYQQQYVAAQGYECP